MNTANFVQIAEDLHKAAAKLEGAQLDALELAAQEVGKSWSGSWLGYHSRIYYRNFMPVPAGARFSKEWGLMDTLAIRDTVGDWHEYEFDTVENEIHKRAKNPKLSEMEALSGKVSETFDESRARLLSLLLAASKASGDDQYLTELIEAARKQKVLAEPDVVELLRPRGQQMSRDSVAINAGFHTPPHIAVVAKVAAIRSPFTSCEELSKVARRAGSHLENLGAAKSNKKVGAKVFIGHGRSRLWRELKDFVQDRLRLPWDEFNREPVAGVTTVARLARMLDESSIALLVMTAEDELADGSRQARMNVIHEIGLFQGRLGFERAIVLLEEGCEEFSNIQGLGQIRFPKGNVSAAFEEVRRIMERERLI